MNDTTTRYFNCGENMFYSVSPYLPTYLPRYFNCGENVFYSFSPYIPTYDGHHLDALNHETRFTLSSHIHLISACVVMSAYCVYGCVKSMYM